MFGLGLVVAGTAGTMPVFILGRAVQGLGGGALIVGLYVIVARVYPERLHPKVFAALSAAWVLPSIVGPSIAGMTADRLSWRLVFLGLVPLVLPGMVLMLPSLRAHGGPPPVAPPHRPAVVPLAVVAAAGVVLMQLGGVRPHGATLAAAAVGAVLLAVAVPRLLPAGTLRAARGLPSVVLLRGLLAAAFFGAESFLPLMLVTLRGVSSSLAGLVLTGGALGWFAGSWWQGRPDLALPRHRLLTVGAVAVVGAIAGPWAVARVGEAPVWVAALAWALGATGMGVGFAGLGVLLLELSPEAERGANSASLQLCDSLLSTVAIGVAGTVYALGRSDTPAADGPVFATIFAVMAGVAALAAVVAPRVRPTAG